MYRISILSATLELLKRGFVLASLNISVYSRGDLTERLEYVTNMNIVTQRLRVSIMPGGVKHFPFRKTKMERPLIPTGLDALLVLGLDQRGKSERAFT